MASRSRRTAAEIAQQLIANIDSDSDDNYESDDDENENDFNYIPSPPVSDDEEDENDLDTTSPVNADDENIIEGNESSSETDINVNQNNSRHFTSPDGTRWAEEVNINNTNTRGRTPVRNIIRHQPGPTRYILNRVDNEYDTFIELLGQDNIRRICEFTVAEARRQGNNDFELSENDLLAFLGLCIIRGVLQGKNQPLSSFWNQEYGINIFQQTMGRNRFKDIKRYIRFDDKSSRTERRQTNKFAPIQELWDSVIKRCGDAFFPGENTTVDEQLFPCKCRCPFLQYIASKPDKFGIKFWIICDLVTKYILKVIPYIGKDDQRDSRMSVPESVVLKLAESYYGSGICVTSDNFFTSSSLAKSLHQKNITLLGTIRPNRREIPREIVKHFSSKQVPIHTSTFLKSQDQMLVAYKAKPNKSVFVLSTEHRSAVIDTNNPKKKPKMITDYNQTKCGVDTADQMLRLYSTKCASRRWPLAVFFNLLDILCLNSFVLAKEMNMPNAKSRRDFMLHIGKVLCSKAKARKRPHSQISTMRIQANHTGSSESRTRCEICRSNKTKVVCCSCDKFVCGKCSSPICQSCISSSE